MKIIQNFMCQRNSYYMTLHIIDIPQTSECAHGYNFLFRSIVWMRPAKMKGSIP